MFTTVIPEVKVEVKTYNSMKDQIDTVTLTCNVVKGNPMDYIYEWIFNNGTTLNSNTSHLILTNFTINQTGTYFCSVTNEAGTGTGNYTLTYGEESTCEFIMETF